MVPSEPEPPDTPASEPKRRRRRSTAVTAEPSSPADSTGEPPPKPRRKRKTKAEKEAARAARQAANSRIDPKGWMIAGLLLLLVAVVIYVDPIGFEEAGRSDTEPWVKVLIELLVVLLGKNPVAITLGVLGALALGWGVRGWLNDHFFRQNDTQGTERSIIPASPCCSRPTGLSLAHRQSDALCPRCFCLRL